MQVSPPTVRGTYGSFVQIATCLGIIVSLLIGTPVKDIDRWSETFCCSPLRACWSWSVWNPSVLTLLLLSAGGEYVSGLQLYQQLYKLLLWSSVPRAPSGYIRCIYFGPLLVLYIWFIKSNMHMCSFYLPYWWGCFYFLVPVKESRLQYTMCLQTMDLYLRLL